MRGQGTLSRNVPRRWRRIGASVQFSLAVAPMGHPGPPSEGSGDAAGLKAHGGSRAAVEAHRDMSGPVPAVPTSNLRPIGHVGRDGGDGS